MAATYRDGDSFAVSKPRVVERSSQATGPHAGRQAIRGGPAAADSSGGPTGSVHVTFLLNFFDELHRGCPWLRWDAGAPGLKRSLGLT
jgi:hypothetical protein